MNFIYAQADARIEQLRGVFTPDLYEKLEAMVAQFFDKLVLAALGAIIVGAMIAGLMSDNEYRDISYYVENAILPGVGGVLILGYLGHRFSSACNAVLKAQNSTISTPALFDVWAVMGGVGVVVCALGVPFMLVSEGVEEAMASLVALVLSFCMLTYSLSPSMISVTVDPRASAGRDVLSLLGAGLKMMLRAVPLTSAALVVAGAGTVLGTSLSEYPSADSGMAMVVAGAGLPFVTYFYFISCYLLIDLMENFLSIKELAARGTAGRE